MKSFTAQLEDIEFETLEDLEYVATQSIQDVMEAAQTPQVAISRGAKGFVEGKIPVDTKELIESLTSEGGGKGPESYVVAIANYELGDEMLFTWTAPHALRIEMGFEGTDSMGRKYDQKGRFFVTRNAEKFSEFVKRRVAEIQNG